MRAIVINRHGGPTVLEPQERPAPPLIAGVEGAGTVVEVGDGVTGVSPGDRVGWVSSQGSYAEQTVVEAERAIPLPDDVSDELAAAALLQGITAHYLVTSAAPVAEGDWALVQAAAGGVGLIATQLVKLHGGHVIGTTS